MQAARSTLAWLLVVTASACAQPGPSDVDKPRQTTATPDRPSKSADPVTSAADYDPSIFEDAANVQNRWYPLLPGSRLFYRGSSLEDGQREQHTVVSIVTDLVKVIDGVPNVVVWERDYTDGELVEAELALFAADKFGNVWHMGEYPEEYEDGKLDKAPAWIHGTAGATAGIMIHGEPQLGTPSYAEGYAPPPINWVDRGKVVKTGVSTCVPADCYQDVVVIAEFEPNLPDAFQDKYYAPSVGVVRVGWRGSKDESKEVLLLHSVTQLTSEQLADAREEALALEQRAYRIRGDVWGETAPAEPSTR